MSALRLVHCTLAVTPPAALAVALAGDPNTHHHTPLRGRRGLEIIDGNSASTTTIPTTTGEAITDVGGSDGDSGNGETAVGSIALAPVDRRLSLGDKEKEVLMLGAEEAEGVVAVARPPKKKDMKRRLRSGVAAVVDVDDDDTGEGGSSKRKRGTRKENDCAGVGSDVSGRAGKSGRRKKNSSCLSSPMTSSPPLDDGSGGNGDGDCSRRPPCFLETKEMKGKRAQEPATATTTVSSCALFIAGKPVAMEATDVPDAPASISFYKNTKTVEALTAVAVDTVNTRSGHEERLGFCRSVEAGERRGDRGWAGGQRNGGDLSWRIRAQLVASFHRGVACGCSSLVGACLEVRVAVVVYSDDDGDLLAVLRSVLLPAFSLYVSSCRCVNRAGSFSLPTDHRVCSPQNQLVVSYMYTYSSILS